MPTKLSRFAAFTLGAAALLTSTSALSSFRARIPNGYNVTGVLALGHTDGTGVSSALNKFGLAFKNASKVWTTALCRADSDGDGQTNGEELGDPCCVWKNGTLPMFTIGVSDPGNVLSKVDPAILVVYTCPTPTGTKKPALTKKPAPTKKK